MAFNPADYHPDWRWIVRQINDQAGDRCEFCGIGNGEISRRGAVVVLTTAHLCHDKPCIDPTHLRALCQKCHLNYDREHHMANAAETRRRKRIAAGQVPLDAA